MITKFQEQYRFLSNFYICPVTYDGVMYSSAEAAYQAQKTTAPEDRALFAEMKPDVAKQMGKAVKLRPDWPEVKQQHMQEILRAKFTQNPQLKAKLLETGDQLLVEGNTWHDNEWGICQCPKCRQVKGQNLLGKALMDLRKSLHEEDEAAERK